MLFRSQAQVSRLMTQAPVGSLAEIAKQNLDYWAKVQEQMIAAFVPTARRAAPTADDSRPSSSPADKKPS